MKFKLESLLNELKQALSRVLCGHRVLHWRKLTAPCKPLEISALALHHMTHSPQRSPWAGSGLKTHLRFKGRMQLETTWTEEDNYPRRVTFVLALPLAAQQTKYFHVCIQPWILQAVGMPLATSWRCYKGEAQTEVSRLSLSFHWGWYLRHANNKRH